MKFIGLIIAAIIAVVCNAASVTYYQSPTYNNIVKDNQMLGNTTVNWFTQSVWHGIVPGDSSTFQQRYFQDLSNYNPSKTVQILLLYISGEQTAGGSPGGYITTVAQELIASYDASITAVTLEHRAFGESFLPTLPGEVQGQNLTALRIDLALMDLAAIRQAYGYAQTCILIGGSYAGSISAFGRLPGRPWSGAFDMSWSSSGVVYSASGSWFDLNIIEDLTRLNVLQQLTLATAIFEEILENDFPAIQELFNTTFWNMTQADAAWMYSDSVATILQYGNGLTFANFINSQPINSTNAFQIIWNYVNEQLGVTSANNCYYSTACLSSESYAPYWGNMRPWVYYCCASNINDSYGFFQPAAPGSTLRLPQYTNMSYFLGQCMTAFGQVPNEDGHNQVYFDPLFSTEEPVDRVIALSQKDDPWRSMCLQESIGPDYPLFYSESCTPGVCGHCADLYGSAVSPAVAVQQSAISIYLNKWVGEVLSEKNII